MKQYIFSFQCAYRIVSYLVFSQVATWLTLTKPGSHLADTTDDDVQPQNFAVHMARRKAGDRDIWHQVVSTATIC